MQTAVPVLKSRWALSFLHGTQIPRDCRCSSVPCSGNPPPPPFLAQTTRVLLPINSFGLHPHGTVRASTQEMATSSSPIKAAEGLARLSRISNAPGSPSGEHAYGVVAGGSVESTEAGNDFLPSMEEIKVAPHPLPSLSSELYCSHDFGCHGGNTRGCPFPYPGVFPSSPCLSPLLSALCRRPHQTTRCSSASSSICPTSGLPTAPTPGVSPSTAAARLRLRQTSLKDMPCCGWWACHRARRDSSRCCRAVAVAVAVALGRP